MSRFLVDPKNIFDTGILLEEKESHHLINVLRFHKGDVVVVFDGTGNEYRCQIEHLEKKECRLSILEKLENKKKDQRTISLAHTVTRGERFDWVVEKGTELGVSEILPFTCERMAVKLNEEQKHKKVDRWERLTQSASKQCGRVILPKVSSILTLVELIDRFSDFDLVLLAYELEVGESLKAKLREPLGKKEGAPNRILAIVGPEGGFSTEEVRRMVQAGAQSVCLGENILRTETAAIAMLAMIVYELMP